MISVKKQYYVTAVDVAWQQSRETEWLALLGWHLVVIIHFTDRNCHILSCDYV